MKNTGSPGRKWAPLWAAAAALALFTLFSVRGTRRLQRELATLQRQIRAERSQNQALALDQKLYQRAQAILAAPATQKITLRPTQTLLPLIRAYWNAELGFVVAGHRIPPPAAGHLYQLWVVPKEGSPISAGLFRPDPGGRVLLVSTPETRTGAPAALRITEEPAAGSLQPTSKPLWAGPPR